MRYTISVPHKSSQRMYDAFELTLRINHGQRRDLLLFHNRQRRRGEFLG